MTPSEEILSAYLDDELSPEERLDVEHRLASDAQWRETLEKLQEVRGWIQDLPPVVPSRPKSISQMLAEDARSGNESQVRLNANSDLTVGPQSWKWLASLAAAAAIVVGSTLWWFSISVDQLAQGPNPQSSNLQSSALDIRENSTTRSVSEPQAAVDGNDQAIPVDAMIASDLVQATEEPAASSPAIRTEDHQINSTNRSSSQRVGNAEMIPSSEADTSLNGMAGGFGGGLGSPAASSGSAGIGGSGSLSKRSNFPAFGAAPGTPPVGAADSTSLRNGEMSKGPTATGQPLEPSPVSIEQFLTARENTGNFAEYAVVQPSATQPEARPETATEELNRQQEPAAGLVGTVIHLKVPADVFVDIQESLANGGLNLQPARASASDPRAGDREKEKTSEASVAGQTLASGVWLLEISADEYESLRNRWSEKGFDISEILDDRKLQVVRLNPANDRSDETEAKKGDENLILLLLQLQSH